MSPLNTEENAEHVAPSMMTTNNGKMAMTEATNNTNNGTLMNGGGEEQQRQSANALEDCDCGDGIRMRVNDKWLHLSNEFVKRHPGGPVLMQYKDADATHIFHAFHEGSQIAYKQLSLLEGMAMAHFSPAEQQQPDSVAHRNGVNTAAANGDLLAFNPNIVVATYHCPMEREKNIVYEFELLRQRVHADGLMEARPWFYVRKTGEVFGLLALAFWLQYRTLYILSAAVMALCWQQMGWLGHEFCHHQPSSRHRRINDRFAWFMGNIAQGYSHDWWKDKHNLHHAATNIIERDGDINLAPLLALVPDDLGRYKTLLSTWLLRAILPYQHWYFTATYPMLRLSWTMQSILHVLSARSSEFKKHRDLARMEQLGLLAHWLWVGAQLWLLPSMPIRLEYFAISQMGAGLLIGLVVSYNHNSVPKFPEHSGLLNNFAALHLLTTRNMRSSIFVDWLWGGLNYQIEHHLFPTMPRPNLSRCAPLVRQFCARTGLPYMEDDFLTGYTASLKLLRQVSEQAALVAAAAASRRKSN